MLSGWIRKLIHHKTAEGQVLPLANGKTREVHALVASLAFRDSMDMGGHTVSLLVGFPSTTVFVPYLVMLSP